MRMIHSVVIRENPPSKRPRKQSSFVLVIYQTQQYANTKAIFHLFEYTTPVLSFWYVRRRNMQIRRRYCTVLNTQRLFCPCDISNAVICKDLGRYCTILNIKHQFCPCYMSNGAICNDIGDIVLFGIHNTRSALVIIISDAAICKDIGWHCTFLKTQHVFLSLWYIRCSNIQRHRAISHIFIHNTIFVLETYQMQQYAKT